MVYIVAAVCLSPITICSLGMHGLHAVVSQTTIWAPMAKANTSANTLEFLLPVERHGMSRDNYGRK